MWNRLQDIPFNIVNHQTIIIDDLVYIIGGCKNKDELKVEKITVFRISQDSVFDNLTSSFTYSWNCNSDSEVTLLEDSNQPLDRYGHTTVKWNQLGILFGGFLNNRSSSSEIYLFVPNDQSIPNRLKLLKNSTKSNFWVLVNGVSGNIPEKRDGHSADIYYDNMFIFGGLLDTDVKRYDNKLYQLNLIMWQWTIIYNGNYIEPLGRDFCSLTVHNNNLYLFGGRSDNKFFKLTCDDIYDTAVWKFDLISNKNQRWIKIHPGHGLITSSSWISSSDNSPNNQLIASNNSQCPFPRRSHMTAVFRNELLVFGGLYATHGYCLHLGDLWSFNLLTSQWSMQSPKKRPEIDTTWPPSLRKGSLTAVNDNCALLIGGVITSNNSNFQGTVVGNSIIIPPYVSMMKDFASISKFCNLNLITPVPKILYQEPQVSFIGSITSSNIHALESINCVFMLQPQLSLYQKSLQIVTKTYPLKQCLYYFVPQKLISDIQTKLIYEENN